MQEKSRSLHEISDIAYDRKPPYIQQKMLKGHVRSLPVAPFHYGSAISLTEK